jgi:hypothetical protein
VPRRPSLDRSVYFDANANLGAGNTFFGTSSEQQRCLGFSRCQLTSGSNVATGVRTDRTRPDNAAMVRPRSLTRSAAWDATTPGNDNCRHRLDALAANTTGADNIATGGFALFSNTTGDVAIERSPAEHDRRYRRGQRCRGALPATLPLTSPPATRRSGPTRPATVNIATGTVRSSRT